MAEKRTIELEIQDNSKSLKSQYKEAVAELQKVSAQYGETSKEAIKAAQAAAKLKDQIGFSKDLVDAFNPDAKFKAVEGAVNGVMNGFQAFTGGMALLGIESTKVEEALLKVQSVMALTQGINGLMEAKDSFVQLGAAAKNALSGIKTGIAATGIGLFVIALGTVVAYWDDIKKAVSGVGAEQKKLNVDAEKNAAASKKSYENAQLEENALRLQGKSEKEILQIRINKMNTSIEDEAIRIKGLEATAKLEIAAAERNQKITEDILRGALEMSVFMIRLLMAPLDLVIATVNEAADVLGFGKVIATDINSLITSVTSSAASYGSKLLFDPAAVKAESAATIAEAKQGLKQMQSDRDGFLLQMKQGNAAATGSASSAAKEQLDITRKMEEETNRLMEEGRAKDLDALRIKYKYEQQEADKNFKEGALKKADYDKLNAQAIESRKADEKTINDKYNKLDKDATIKAAEDQIKLQDEQWYALQKLKNTQQEQALLDLQIAYDKEFEAALNNTILQKELTDKFNKDSAAINKKYKDEQAVADKAAADLKISNQAAEDAADLARIQAKTDMALKIAKTFSDVYNSLNGLMNASDNERLKGVEKGSKAEEEIKKRMFKRDKKLRIVQTIIDTASNVVNSVRNGGGIPYGIPFGIAAAAMGGLQLAAISKAKFQGEDGGGGEKPTPPAAMTAQFNTVGNNGINQLAQLQQQPTMAYVVSGQVTSQQALDRNRAQNSSL